MIQGGMPTIYVSNLEKSVEFYTKVLGLKMGMYVPGKWATVDAGAGLSIGLHPAGPHSPKPGTNGSTMVGLSVTKPIDEVVKTLQQRGAKFHGPVIDDAQGSIRLAFFSDPDGNQLYLCEYASSKKSTWTAGAPVKA